jgi:hypothetical protein
MYNMYMTISAYMSLITPDQRLEGRLAPESTGPDMWARFSLLRVILSMYKEDINCMLVLLADYQFLREPKVEPRDGM